MYNFRGLYLKCRVSSFNTCIEARVVALVEASKASRTKPSGTEASRTTPTGAGTSAKARVKGVGDDELGWKF